MLPEESCERMSIVHMIELEFGDLFKAIDQ